MREHCLKISPVRLKTPSLNITINGVVSEALLDTGASVSIICESLIDKDNITVSKRKVFDANGNAIKIVGETKIKLIINDGRQSPTNFTENFVVIRDNSLDIQLLFGMNILKYTKLNFDEGTLIFNDKGSKDYPCKVKLEVLTQVLNSKEHHYIGDRISALIEEAQNDDITSNTKKLQEQRDPLLSERTGYRQSDSCDNESVEEMFNLHLRDNVDLQANAVNVIKIKAPRWCKEKSHVVVCKHEHVKKGLIVGNALCSVDEGHLWVHIINITDENVTLTQGSHLCKAHELHSYEIDNVGVLSDGTHTEVLSDKPIEKVDER